MDEYKDKVKTANERGLSANANFDRIVGELQDMQVNASDPERQILDDAVLLLQQQWHEIQSHHDSQTA